MACERPAGGIADTEPGMVRQALEARYRALIAEAIAIAEILKKDVCTGCGRRVKKCPRCGWNP